MDLIIPDRLIEERRERILRFMERDGIDLLYLVSAANIAYLSRFHFIPTERPMALLLYKDGSTKLYVPLLEYEHASKYAHVDEVIYYREYPDEINPIKHLADIISRDGGISKIGYDVDGYGHIFGFRGPRLSQLLSDRQFIYYRDVVEDMRLVKDEYEVRLLKESSRWTSLVHRYLQEYVDEGLYEDEVSMKASMKATLEMIRELKGRYLPVGWITGARAGFRGQVGEHSYYPHSLTQHAIFKKTQVLVTGAGASVSGYSVELERTMFLGEPTREMEKYFNLMCRAQETAFEMIKPGNKCSDVDRAVRRFFRENGLMGYWRHHTGHGIGLEYHEAPFLDIGDDREIKPGMVLTVEPGIYVKGLGGFRHSDTVLVTEDGIELLTDYPRDIEALTIE